MTQQALIAYAVGLIGLIMVKILAPGFYARQDIKTPVKMAVITLVFTQLMNLALSGNCNTRAWRWRLVWAHVATPACCTGNCAAKTSLRRSRAGRCSCSSW